MVHGDFGIYFAILYFRGWGNKGPISQNQGHFFLQFLCLNHFIDNVYPSPVAVQDCDCTSPVSPMPSHQDVECDDRLREQEVVHIMSNWAWVLPKLTG